MREYARTKLLTKLGRPCARQNRPSRKSHTRRRTQATLAGSHHVMAIDAKSLETKTPTHAY